jgi:hypothetical protein
MSIKLNKAINIFLETPESYITTQKVQSTEQHPAVRGEFSGQVEDGLLKYT